jgi:hypothetical protein
MTGTRYPATTLCFVSALVLATWTISSSGISPVELIVIGSVVALVVQGIRSMDWRIIRCPNCGKIRSRLRPQPCAYCGHRLG